MDPTTPINPSSAQHSSPFFSTLLIGIALILLGALIGVLAARFIPMSSGTILPLPENSPTPTVTEEIITPTVEITPIPEPTATPSALLNLKWNMMTVKSPLTTFSDYKIYYPTTWTIKEYKNISKPNNAGSSTLILTKGKIALNIMQSDQLAPSCDYSRNPVMGGEGIVLFDEYRSILKTEPTSWRWAPISGYSTPKYLVCESKINGAFGTDTSIGLIEITSDTNFDELTASEINYILEKIVVLK